MESTELFTLLTVYSAQDLLLIINYHNFYAKLTDEYISDANLQRSIQTVETLCVCVLCTCVCVFHKTISTK